MKTGAIKPAPSIITFLRTDDRVEFEKKWDEAMEFLALAQQLK